MRHELVELALRINWKSVEKDFGPYYSEKGRPAVPMRKMVGCMLLKQMYNQSDEAFTDRWIENPYWQYFCGETYFQYEKPFDPSEFVHFRKRLGTEGAEILLKLSLSLFEAKEVEEKEVLIDTTVQEKNITFPTDTKLHKKIIEGCWKISQKEAIELRQSYKRTISQLMIDQRFREHLKSDYRMLRNYLRGVEGDMINTIMAAASFNMMKKLRQIRNAIYFVLDQLARYWSVKYITLSYY